MSIDDRVPYWGGSDLEKVDRCPVCGAPANEEPFHSAVPDLLENIPGKWDIAKCSECKSLHLSTRPRSGAMHKAYRTYYTHKSAPIVASASQQSWVWAIVNDYLYRRYGANRLPRIAIGSCLVRAVPPIRQQLDYFLRRLPRNAGKLLDVGCGNGAFLERARECGWEVHGIEPDPAAAQVATEVAQSIYQTTFEEFDTSLRFDAITASHVIEHVYDPLAFVKRAFSLLKPEGTLWLSTPNGESIGHAIFGAGWRGLEPPRHVSIFSARALTDILHRAGFDKVMLHRRGRGSKYIIQESQKNLIRLGIAKRKPVAPFFVDLAASAFPTRGEELVVTAVRPR